MGGTTQGGRENEARGPLNSHQGRGRGEGGGQKGHQPPGQGQERPNRPALPMGRGEGRGRAIQISISSHSFCLTLKSSLVWFTSPEGLRANTRPVLCLCSHCLYLTTGRSQYHAPFAPPSGRVTLGGVKGRLLAPHVSVQSKSRFH